MKQNENVPPMLFFPFFPLHQDAGTPEVSDDAKTPDALLERGGATSARPIRIDVEKAVAVMLATSEAENDSMRQKCRLDIIKTVPLKSIVWDTVDWVQIWPFQPVRQ